MSRSSATTHGRLGRLARRATAVLLVLAASPWAAGEDAPQRAFLWRVQSPSSTLHLLGSVHLMSSGVYPLADPIERAFERSGVAVFEVDLDQLTSAAFQLLAEGTLPGEQNLRDVVSAETFELASRRLAELGLEPEGFQKMRPWLLAVTLTTLELTRSGYSQAEGVDVHFFERAKDSGKRIVALETVEFQVRLFADMTRAEDEDFLKVTLEEMDTVVPLMEQLVRDWQAGNAAAVEGLLTESYAQAPELFAKLVTRRNLDWLPRLEELLAGRDDAIAVVGALHLLGDQGLVELLRRRGYRVEQL